jgi:hypothetical protein
MRITLCSTLCLASLLLGPAMLFAAKPAEGDLQPGGYRQVLQQAEPAVVWHFEGEHPLTPEVATGAGDWTGSAQGAVDLAQEGPRPPLLPLFAPSNQAAGFDGRTSSVRYADPGEASVLDFAQGDSITLEAWVNVTRLSEGQQSYIVGKGRTNNPGVARENQNYALRLRGEGGSAKVSFLFRSEDEEGQAGAFHRWNSTVGFPPGTGWRHVAVSYTFGKPESIRGYVDGVPTDGTWDIGGATGRAPVVDNDQLWIGSSMGGNPGSTFQGQIDAVAIYRRIVSEEQLASHFKLDPKALASSLPAPPEGSVLVEIVEGVPANSWELSPRSKPSMSFEQSQLALAGLPQKYDDQGLIADLNAPLLVRSIMKKELPPGSYDVLLRSFDGARLLIDGRPVVQTRFSRTGGNAHGDVPQLSGVDDPDFYPPAIGHVDEMVTIELTGGEHVFQLEAVAGGKNNRPEIGELCVALKSTASQRFEILSPTAETTYPVTYDGWDAFAHAAREQVSHLDQTNRRAAAANDRPYWQQRREVAREIVLSQPAVEIPAARDGLPEHNEVDRFVNAKLAELEESPSELTDDYEFVRRVSLDIRGIIPRPAEIQRFLADRSPERRRSLIDRFLEDPRWADNWVPYWQDVLAENPGILKPMLNNTGPYRFWIRESFADNKPFDRFVTELLAMEGSRYYGGPAGFAMATENDVPMAAKAHVAAQAFLGVEMKCARCHDAPYHPFRQSDLFEIAAMLERSPLKLPKSSTVPVAEGGRQPLVEITLKPGAVLQPQWPFAEQIVGEALPAGFVREQSNSRERLAALFTSPHNERFAQVIVNRMWQRYLGIGLVEPVDDWHDAEASHPALLDYLARELVLSGYDLKHVARTILNSHAYQRRVTPESSRVLTADLRSFAAPARRRLSAEQLVDSLFVAAGKEFGTEQLTLDPENRLAVKTFINLGEPTRSWEFVSLSNERDRPALALPVAQSFVDALAMFGWRDSRQNPLTDRENAPTALQPLTLGNGIMGNRLTTLSDDSALTELALRPHSPESLIDAVALRILARPARTAEHELFLPLVRQGFADRVVQADLVVKHAPRHAVSWTNHLSAEATEIKMELEEAAQRGDPPTQRLNPDWRERMEDVIWALANSPEFVFVP